MNQLFNITIDGVNITAEHGQCTISEETGRAYDTASFTISDQLSIILKKDVVINYGDKTFTGFVYSSRKVGVNSRSVLCRTNTAKFTDPFSTSEKVLDDATTSHALCSLYSAQTGIPIVNTSADLDFGGSYERDGTILSALTNIASVTGSEIYDDGNGSLIIAPNKPIDSDGVIIPDGDIFNFIEDSNSVFNNGVGFVIIQNGGQITSDIISDNQIYAEVDECSGELFVFPNPYAPIDESAGISDLKAIVLERKEERSLLDEDIVRLDGAIESIKSITLNGAIISNYNLSQGHNVLYFTTTQRGTLEVVYNAYAYQGFTNIKVTPLGRFISFDMFYLDQAMKFQGFLSADCANTQTDGDMTCITPNEMRYDKGFNVYTIGGDPAFSFYNKNVVMTNKEVSSAINYVSVEQVTLEETLTGYRYRSRYAIGTALGVQTYHTDVPYTTGSDADGDFFEFTDYFPDMMVSYETPAQKHFVQFPRIIDGRISMVIKNNNTDEVCEYLITSDIPCELDQDIYVNVAQEIDIEVTTARGALLEVVTPDVGSTYVTVDVFGFVAIPVTINGDYVINTNSLKLNTSITLTAKV